MATRLSFRQWDGGDGMHDRFIHLFECKESPQEVLPFLFKNHLIYSYKGLSQPVDRGFPNNAEGLIIKDIALEDPYSLEIFSQRGLSIHELDPKRIKGYDYSIGRSPMVFEKTIAGHIKSELAPRDYYGYEGLEKMQPVRAENYLSLRNSEIIARLKEDVENVVYKYPNGEEAREYFVAAKWVAKQEAQLQIIFEVAQVILEIKTVDDLLPLYEKYKEGKAHVY